MTKIQSYKEGGDKLDIICKHIEMDKKCKLPWTINEIKDAITAV